MIVCSGVDNVGTLAMTEKQFVQSQNCDFFRPLSPTLPTHLSVSFYLLYPYINRVATKFRMTGL